MPELGGPGRPGRPLEEGRLYPPITIGPPKFFTFQHHCIFVIPNCDLIQGFSDSNALSARLKMVMFWRTGKKEEVRKIVRVHCVISFRF
jgi:hypothetical protein